MNSSDLPQEAIIVSRLDERMKLMGIKTKTLARAIRSHPYRVRRWRSGVTIPPLMQALLICEVLMVRDLKDLWTIRI